MQFRIKKILNFKFFIFFIIFMYLAGGMYLYIFQRSFLYYPTKKIKHNEIVKKFKIDNENIEVIVLNPNQKDAILYFGGRSEAVANNIEEFKKIFPKFAVYLLNYRGYANSSGVPTEKNLYKDAMFVYNKVAKKYKNISIIGRSLGTGIATYVAARSKVKKMVLITPYDSILNMALDKYPFYPINYILEDKFESVKRVEAIKIPILVFLASDDKTIDKKYSYNLINKLDPSNLKIYIVDKVSHSNIVNKQEYYEQLSRFFN